MVLWQVREKLSLPSRARLWPPSMAAGIKMADAEKMATEMGFSGAQAKEAAPGQWRI